MEALKPKLTESFDPSPKVCLSVCRSVGLSVPVDSRKLPRYMIRKALILFKSKIQSSLIEHNFLYIFQKIKLENVFLHLFDRINTFFGFY